MNAQHRLSVLLIGDTLNVGGTEGQFVEIACGVDRSRWDVHVACLRAEGPLRARLEAAGIQPWSCGRGSLRSPHFAGAVFSLARYLRVHRIRLVHSFDFYSNVLGIPAARLARVPAVIASQRDLGDLRPRLQQWIHHVVLRAADHVLVNSEAVVPHLKLDQAIVPRPIVVVPNGVDLARFSPAPAPRRRPAGRVTVGTVANLRPEKGLPNLIRAAADVRERYPEGRFLIWGEGPMRPELELMIDKLGLTGAVTLPGSTPTPEMALRELDIFVLPSLSEASSNVLLEAMATGLPVVATRVGGNSRLVQDEVTGLLVPPADPAALAKAVIRLIEQPALATQVGTRARELVEAEFGIDRLLARVQSLYDRALAAAAA